MNSDANKAVEDLNVLNAYLQTKVTPDEDDDLWLDARISNIKHALRSKSEWQPIETAPRDGTELLLWCEPHMVCGKFQGIWEMDTEWVGQKDPTQWQHLPTPPQKDNTDGQ